MIFCPSTLFTPIFLYYMLLWTIDNYFTRGTENQIQSSNLINSPSRLNCNTFYLYPLTLLSYFYEFSTLYILHQLLFQWFDRKSPTDTHTHTHTHTLRFFRRSTHLNILLKAEAGTRGSWFKPISSSFAACLSSQILIRNVYIYTRASSFRVRARGGLLKNRRD